MAVEVAVAKIVLCRSDVLRGSLSIPLDCLRIILLYALAEGVTDAEIVLRRRDILHGGQPLIQMPAAHSPREVVDLVNRQYPGGQIVNRRGKSLAGDIQILELRIFVGTERRSHGKSY